MKCPACKNEMVVLELHEVELDHCMECRGSWFDAEELETLMERSGAGPEFEIPYDPVPARRAGESPRRCPRCSKKMEKAAVRGDDKLILDRCRLHKGFWFDGGELQRFLSGRLENESWKKVNDFLRDILGEGYKKEDS